MTQIAILGTGLIGASIGLALKANDRLDGIDIIGYDREKKNLSRAKKIGAVDRSEKNITKAVRDASIIVLAAPVLANHRMIEEVASHLNPGVVVTDTGSTKAATIKVAHENLPEGVSFVGGHPMAGKTEVGPDNASAELFQDARWVVSAPSWASEVSVKAVLGLAEAVGAVPVIMDADEHDAYLAAVSHLPMLSAQVMFRLVRRSEAWPELGQLAAGGFKSSTRLAATDPSMAYDILTTNKEQTVHWLNRFIDELQEMRGQLQDADQEILFQEIAQVELDYSAFQIGAFRRESKTDSAMDRAKLDFSSLLIGELAREKIAQITRDSEERLKEIEIEDRMRRNID